MKKIIFILVVSLLVFCLSLTAYAVEPVTEPTTQEIIELETILENAENATEVNSSENTVENITELATFKYATEPTEQTGPIEATEATEEVTEVPLMNDESISVNLIILLLLFVVVSFALFVLLLK